MGRNAKALRHLRSQRGDRFGGGAHTGRDLRESCTKEHGIFLCLQITGGTMMTSDESDALAYFPFKEIPRYTSPYHRARIQDVLETPSHFHLKVQHRPPAKKVLHQGK